MGRAYAIPLGSGIMIIEFTHADECHSDLMQSLLLILRYGVKSGQFRHEKVEPIMVLASNEDSGNVRFMVESLMRGLK